MSLTRLQAEELMYRRLGPAMYRADMNVEVDGKNPNYADPLAWALTELDYSPAADITDPQDSDLAQVSSADTYHYLALAEWRMLMNVIGNLDDTDEKLGPTGMWNSQFAKQMQVHLEKVEDHLMGTYGWGPPTLATGTIRIITQQQDV